MKILIVEDNSEISGLLSEFLSRNGYETDLAEDGRIASIRLRMQDYDIVLMDLMLPYKSGEELIREMREYSQVPVIVLSAKSMLETRLEVLRIGADDYILKPFDLDEVLVRIEVVLRRSGMSSSRSILTYGELSFDTENYVVSYKGNSISLTSKESQLLRLFMEYPQKVYTKANLYESVWNEPYFYEDNTINVHVSNLRSKLKRATGRDCIETVWGIGYRMKEVQM